MEPVGKQHDGMAVLVNKTKQEADKPGTSTAAGVPKQFRRLRWNELVSQGDFVIDPQGRFEPWEGLNGFQAGAFVKPIYRRDKNRVPLTKELK